VLKIGAILSLRRGEFWFSGDVRHSKVTVADQPPGTGEELFFCLHVKFYSEAALILVPNSAVLLDTLRIVVSGRPISRRTEASEI
jgi:hypothetical protein